MIRLIATMLFWVVMGRYLYAETKILFPSATPVIDSVLATLEIPTHDKWNPETVAQLKESGRAAVDATTERLFGAGYDRQALDSMVVRAVTVRRAGETGLQEF